jgi:hypothetical protein
MNNATMPFIERHTTGDQELVVLRYAAVFYWLMWPTLTLTIAASSVTSRAITVAACVAWILLIASAAPYWGIILQLKRRMREGSVSVSGSKYSLSNPLSYRWTTLSRKNQNSN